MLEKGSESTEEVEKKVGEENESKQIEKIQSGEEVESEVPKDGSGDCPQKKNEVTDVPTNANDKVEEDVLDSNNLKELDKVSESTTEMKKKDCEEEENVPKSDDSAKIDETENKSSEKNVASSDEEEKKVLTNTIKEKLKAHAEFNETPQGKLTKMMKDGYRALFDKKDPEEAAEILGQACEKAREIHGEMGDGCVDAFFLYGCSMLECSKILENTVFGESLPQKDGDKEEQSEEEADEEAEEPEVMVNKRGAKNKEVIPNLVQPKKENPKKEKEDKGEELTEENEDEDNMLRAAWEMFELCKIIYLRQNRTSKIADIYMKLGEVSVESGNISAIDDMKEALTIRKTIYEETNRIIPETHFHIGLSYSFFQMFDEAIDQFSMSKKLLEDRITLLEKEDNDKAREEIKEIHGILPEIEEKINDMVGSKEEKLKAEKAKMNGEGTSESPKKEATNISHLVKRKRKIDDVTCELKGNPPKTVCLEGENESK